MTSLRACGVLLGLVVALTACGDDDDRAGGPSDEKSGGKSGAPTSASTTTGDDVVPTVTPESDGGAAQEGLRRGAAVADFCGALAEIDEAIDTAGADDADDWLRVVAAFDALFAVGVPDDLPAGGIDEIDQVDRLVRQSDSTAEFFTAAEESPPESEVIDDYIDAHCKR